MQSRSLRISSRLGYWPFSLAEVEVALGILGILATILTIAGATVAETSLGLGMATIVLYIVGLIAHCAQAPQSLGVYTHGAEGGAGYVPLFREATRSLLLMHVDDDSPSAELVALYTQLLEQGVQIRRLVVERAQPASTLWARELSAHPGLRQAFIPYDDRLSLALSFAVIDEQSVVLALPGTAAVDNPPYQESFVLRHLVHIRDAVVAAAFVQTHEAQWNAAKVQR